ncbi:Uncharacterised protein [Acetobacterium wieringae]|nr:Uncharacterised protein [Acetobacterium wieringae]
MGTLYLSHLQRGLGMTWGHFAFSCPITGVTFPSHVLALFEVGGDLV